MDTNTNVKHASTSAGTISECRACPVCGKTPKQHDVAGIKCCGAHFYGLDAFSKWQNYVLAYSAQAELEAFQKLVKKYFAMHLTPVDEMSKDDYAMFCFVRDNITATLRKTNNR